MLRRFLVWVSCFIMDAYIVYSFPEKFHQYGEFFFNFHIAATLLMWVCQSIGYTIDEPRMDDFSEIQDKLHDIDIAKWDIVFSVLMLITAIIVSTIFDLNKFLLYEVALFGQIFNKLPDIDWVDFGEEDEKEETKETKEKDNRDVKQ